LDEQRCSSATEAVLSATSGDIVFGLRLRHVDDKLIDVEAQVIYPHLEYYNPDGVVVIGDDPWLQPLAADKRQDASALIAVAESFWEAPVEPSTMPSAAAGCEIRQNGVEVGVKGSCVLARDGQRFEQARFPVVDVTIGVVTSIGRRRGFLFMGFARVQDSSLLDVEIVGGVANATTGW
jgi:hypothetical protein